MLKKIMAVAGLLLAVGGAAHAEGTSCDAARPGENKQQEYQRLLDCTRQSILDAKARLNFLSDMKMDELEASLERERDILNGLIETRNAALNTANEDIAKLKADNDELTRQLQAANEDNDKANARIAALQIEIERLASELNAAKSQNDELTGKIAALQAVIDQLQAQLEELNTNLKAAKEQQAELTKKVDDLTTALNAASKNVTDQATALGTQITDLKTALDEANGKVGTLSGQIDKLTTDLADAKAKIADLSGKLDTTTKALTTATDKITELEKAIADLTAKLQVATQQVCALTNKLGPFSIEFVTGLHAIFGDDPNVFVVGNRLIVAAEVLFPSGSDKIEKSGLPTISKAADFIKTFEAKIPADIAWIIQINGHTDIRPIHTKRFPSNWELSTARAVAVVNVLRDQKIAGKRLAAAGYAEFQPLAEGTAPETLHHNRRIEIELTNNGTSGEMGASLTASADCAQ